MSVINELLLHSVGTVFIDFITYYCVYIDTLCPQPGMFPLRHEYDVDVPKEQTKRRLLALSSDHTGYME